jgi:hypothetical protein
MYAMLNAEIGSAEEFPAAARGWLTGVLSEVFPMLQPDGNPAQEADQGNGVGVVGTLTVNRKDQVSWREMAYSHRTWPRFLAELDDYPFVADAHLGLVGDQGEPLHASAEIRVARDFFSPQWASFQFTARADGTGWPESAQLQGRWAEFVKAQAAAIGAVGGEMTDDVAPPETALQRATFNTFAGVPDSRTVLRGYSWVTIMAPELVARLGGASALEASGAFCDVTELPTGALWLRATSTLNQFTGDRVRRVFEALAPVLVTGIARFHIPGETYRIVEGADAAAYQ